MEKEFIWLHGHPLSVKLFYHVMFISKTSSTGVLQKKYCAVNSFVWTVHIYSLGSQSCFVWACFVFLLSKHLSNPFLVKSYLHIQCTPFNVSATQGVEMLLLSLLCTMRSSGILDENVSVAL